MSALTTWRTDDPCPVCGTCLYLTDDLAGNLVSQDCPLCGWSTTWQTIGEGSR
jgi:endogenous inhibitor of DNA gyrase (YacG/DUF329 family)